MSTEPVRSERIWCTSLPSAYRTQHTAFLNVIVELYTFRNYKALFVCQVKQWRAFFAHDAWFNHHGFAAAGHIPGIQTPY